MSNFDTFHLKRRTTFPEPETMDRVDARLRALVDASFAAARYGDAEVRDIDPATGVAALADGCHRKEQLLQHASACVGAAAMRNAGGAVAIT